MLEKRDLHRCVGSKLRAVIDNGCGVWLIVFTDCFACIHGYDYYGSNEIDDCDFDHTDFDKAKLIQVGIMSLAEINTLEAKREELRRKAREEQERVQYERLRQKFELADKMADTIQRAERNRLEKQS